MKRDRSQLLDGTTPPNIYTSRGCGSAARVGVNTVAIIGALGSITTIVSGWLGLEEVMTLLQLAGAALVLVGVIVISLNPAKT